MTAPSLLPPSAPALELSVPPEAAGLRLDVYLSSAEHGLPFSRSQLGRRITAGEVLLDGNPSRPGYRLRAGQRIVFTPAADQPPGDHPEDIPLEILFEDRHLIVVNKPAGMVVHPAPGHETGTLVNALLHHCGELPLPPVYVPNPAPDEDQESDDEGDEPEGEGLAGPGGLSIGGQRRPGIVHRLDQGTSGVLVCAKDEPTLVGLQAQFQIHSITRRYLALVEGVTPERGTINTRYGRHPQDRKRFTGKRGGKRAVTHFAVVMRLAGATLIEVQLETGRTHQIRVHMSEAGHPVLGDPIYGQRSKQKLVRAVGDTLGHQALHARLLGFIHPMTREALCFSAPPPADFQQALTALRGEVSGRTDETAWYTGKP